jgi:hypothetical protein
MKILMFYYYSPNTTAFYLEQAFRRVHEVKTCGPQAPGALHQDIPLKSGMLNIKTVLNQLRQQMHWQPDLFIMVDSPYTLYPWGIHAISIPTIFYVIDTHIALAKYKSLTPIFDFVFIAQKEYVEPIKKAGARHAAWLPLACDPNLHKRYDLPKIYDICFLGHQQGGRKRSLERLARHFNLYSGFVNYAEMTYIYSQSKIVFNKSLGNDINMRVFEALSSGSLLLTNRLINNGLDDLFQDKEELVLYDENNLEELASYYLNHEEERKRIATSGFNKVRSRHTYDHRVESIIRFMQEHASDSLHHPSWLDEKIAMTKVKFYQSRLGKWRLR